MKRSIIWLLAIGLVLPGLLAQDRSVQTIDPVRIYDGTVEHQKTVLAAKVFEFRYPAKDLANAIGRYFQDRGGKLSKVKGLTVVSGIRLHDSDDGAYDVYYQIKPIFPRGLQIRMRRLLARHKRRVFSHVWPVDPGAATAPQGWNMP